MIRHTRIEPTTFADFLELIQEDQKADLIDGVIYRASPENKEHNRLLRWLTTVLGQYVDERNLGELTVNRVAFRLSNHTAPEPDVGFIQADRLHLFKSGYMDGPPDLAVEIVSPSSGQRDYEDKRRRYEEAGVWEYWIVDPEEQTVTFLIRGEQGFEEVFPQGSIFRSRLLAGLELDVRWLWQEPLPHTLLIVQRLLARPASDSGDRD